MPCWPLLAPLLPCPPPGCVCQVLFWHALVYFCDGVTRVLLEELTRISRTVASPSCSSVLPQLKGEAPVVRVPGTTNTPASSCRSCCSLTFMLACVFPAGFCEGRCASRSVIHEAQPAEAGGSMVHSCVPLLDTHCLSRATQRGTGDKWRQAPAHSEDLTDREAGQGPGCFLCRTTIGHTCHHEPLWCHCGTLSSRTQQIVAVPKEG